MEHPVQNLTVRAELTLRKRLDNVLGDAALKNYLRRDLEFEIPTSDGKTDCALWVSKWPVQPDSAG